MNFIQYGRGVLVQANSDKRIETGLSMNPTAAELDAAMGLEIEPDAEVVDPEGEATEPTEPAPEAPAADADKQPEGEAQPEPEALATEAVEAAPAVEAEAVVEAAPEVKATARKSTK